MRIKGGSAPITLDTLRAMRMVQPIRIAHKTQFRVIGGVASLAKPVSPPSPPAPHSPSTPPTKPSTSHAAPSMSSPLYRRWIGRSMMRIAAHLGVQLSPPPSSLTLAQRHVGVDSADLEYEGSESSDSNGGDDSGSEGASA